MKNNEKKESFEYELEMIAYSLRRMQFIRDGFRNLDDGGEALYAEMIEGVLPAIVESLGGGFSILKEKLL